jgi:hypothetical protein
MSNLPAHFTASAREYDRLEDERDTLAKQVKEIVTREKELNGTIETFMKENDIPAISVGNTTYKLATTKKVAPFNKETVVGLVKTHPIFQSKPDDEVSAFVEYIFEKRPATEQIVLRKSRARTKTTPPPESA